EPTRDTSRVGTGRESGTLGDPRAPHVAAGESRRDRRGTPAPPTPLCEACPARRRLAASPLRRHPPIERCAPGAYPACRAGFASRGTAVARGTVPSRSRLAPTRDIGLGSRYRPEIGFEVGGALLLESRAAEECLPDLRARGAPRK